MTYEVLQFGEKALLVNFPQEVSPEINDSVLLLNDHIKENFAGVTFTIPAYCSLTIGYDPSSITAQQLIGSIESAIRTLQDQSYKPEVGKLNIPTCYDEPFCIDRRNMESHTEALWEDIVSAHTSQLYRVYMLGFKAGFPYMGIVSNAIRCPRLSNARPHVSAGSVGIAGSQTGIYPVDAPGGWNIIGRTPVPIIRPGRQEAEPFLFSPGVAVKFEVISTDQYFQIEREVAHGKFDYTSLIG